MSDLTIHEALKFLLDNKFAALSWDSVSQALTAYRRSNKCDIYPESGLEPFEKSEFAAQSQTYNKFVALENQLHNNLTPSFFIKSLV